MGLINVRGGMADRPMQLRGQYTGYNSGPTMQIGLWLANDGEQIETVRRMVQRMGAVGLARYVIDLMRDARPYSAAWQVRQAVSGWDVEKDIDWGQIAFGLLDTDVDEADLDQARQSLGAGAEQSAVFLLAADRKTAASTALVMQGRQ